MTSTRQLHGFLVRYSPAVASLARKAIAKMRRLAVGATEMVYDNYNGVVIGFGPTERASEAIFSIALYPRHVNLFFLQGAALSDPDKILQGSGNVVRRIQLENAKTLDAPAVRALISEALRHARVPLDPTQRRRLVVKSVSNKQRPRRGS
jgi:hypothetical protein